jgi:nitroreductase
METVGTGAEKRTTISEERYALCMRCGQCVAVCPTDSITIDGLEPEGFRPFEQVELDSKQMLNLMRRRRSVRRYRDRPVPREVLDRIIEAAHLAPTGNAGRSVGAIIIDRPEKLEQLSELTCQLYAKLDKALRNPIARLFVRRKVGKSRLKTLTEFVMPGVRWYMRWRREGKGDEITRESPALILFHSRVDVPVADENCLIAATFAMFMAETLGVGSYFNGLIGPAVDQSPALRALLDLPPDHGVYACLALGYGKYTYRTSIPRALQEVRYLE